VAEELINEFGDELETITLVRGGKGRFEVTADGQEVYSKSRTKRHAEPGEVTRNLGDLLHANGQDGLTLHGPVNTVDSASAM
jgi:predicted Rdx family selenoprotein